MTTGNRNLKLLDYISKSGDCAIDRCLAAVIGGSIDETDQNGDTVLISAIRYQNFQIAEQLIKYGAEVNVKNNCCRTALLYAVTNTSDLDTVKFVPKLSVPETVETYYWVESLNFAFEARDNEVIQKLRKSPNYDSDRLSLVKMLLSAGAEVNHRDINGCSPIQCAVYTGDVELLKTLIDAGADIESQNCLGVTALHDAILCRNKEMVDLLLTHGLHACGRSWAYLDLKTVKGNTPLHWAALFNRYYSHADIIKELLEHHPVDLDIRNARGQTPFHFIIMNGGINLVIDFIMHKSNLEMEDRDGMNACHYANHNEDKADVINAGCRR
ncbi:putative ankyrin repeat protein RF_0381 isoform X2 [Nasonia vitripennis]|uniref:Uncharacterized protein n=1 Tax=Nasonia vitripennis TaxID=7425 RepID=A0A7M7Q2K6_NASVI|nr:putative ankyrin repeat protein RF_0381 isoform X2 [Nasonia vitripennis]